MSAEQHKESKISFPHDINLPGKEWKELHPDQQEAWKKWAENAGTNRNRHAGKWPRKRGAKGSGR